MTAPILSLHVYHAGALEPLLLEVVEPALRHSQRQGASTRWFYLRYWNGGPHLRLRVECQAAPAEVEAHLRPALESYLSRATATTDDAERYRRSALALRELEARLGAAAVGALEPLEPLQPQGAVQVRPYQLDARRYGADGAELALEHAWTSSRVALAVLEVTRARPALRHTFALHAAAAAAARLDAAPAERAAYFAEASRWSAPAPGLDEHQRWSVAGYAPWAEQRAALAEVWRAAAPGDDALGLLLAAWRGELDRYRASLGARPAGSLPPTELLLLDATHLLCNRLGVSLEAECYLYYLIAASLDDGQAGAIGAGGTG